MLTELFEGTGKRFCFNATTKIDQQLYKIYEKFPKSENTNWILKFSSTQSERPFVSFENFECLKCCHKILTENGFLYIYE